MRRSSRVAITAANVVMAFATLLGLAGIVLATNLFVSAMYPYAAIRGGAAGPWTISDARPLPVEGVLASGSPRLANTPAATPLSNLTPTSATRIAATPTVVIAPTSIAAVTTDFLDDLGGVAELSPGLTIDTTNQGFIGGDRARLVRTGHDPAWAVWSLPGMADFTAVTYHYPWAGPLGAFTFAASPDGVQFAAVAPGVVDRGGDWQRIDYVLALPPDTAFVRVTFPSDSAYPWTPQIGEVSYGNGAAPPR